MFWVALLLVFAQVAHAFDACAAHLENTRPLVMSVSAPCSAGHSCELCAFAPGEDICQTVSELAPRATSSFSLDAPPVIIVDALFVSSPVPHLEVPTLLIARYADREVPPLRSQYLAPRLAGRAPPLSV